MSFVLLLAAALILILAGYLHYRQQQAAPDAIPSQPRETGSEDITIPVHVSVTVDNVLDPKPAAPVREDAKTWILNADTHFPLTLEGLTSDQAETVSQILSTTLSAWDARDRILPIIARHNVGCKEIDELVERFRPEYLRNLEDLKRTSREWATVSELDRDDLLLELKRAAVGRLEIIPQLENDRDDASYETAINILDASPSDLTVDDKLIDKYGLANLQFYLRVLPSAAKPTAYQIDIDHYNRRNFELLVEVGLAVRGADIPPKVILGSLLLREMNEIAADLVQEPFGRKAKALAFLSSVPDINERVRKRVPLRSMFSPVPLPEEFSSIPIDELAASIKYSYLLSALIVQAYRSARAAKRSQEGGAEYVKKWRVQSGKSACRFCKRFSQQAYHPGHAPSVPFHIGCRCWILADYSEEGEDLSSNVPIAS